MADPISLAAVAGLIYVGRALSDKTEPAKVVQRIADKEQTETNITNTPVSR